MMALAHRLQQKPEICIKIKNELEINYQLLYWVEDRNIEILIYEGIFYQIDDEVFFKNKTKIFCCFNDNIMLIFCPIFKKSFNLFYCSAHIQDKKFQKILIQINQNKQDRNTVTMSTINNFLPLSQISGIQVAKPRRQNTNFNTNVVLMYYQGGNKPTFYLPTYVRCKILSIAKIQYSEMTAEVNAEILVTINCPSNPNIDGQNINLKERILDEGIKCSFEKGPCLTLKRDNPDITIQDESFGLITYIIRTFISTTLVCDDILWAPFETVTCRISLSLYRVRVHAHDADDHEKKEQRKKEQRKKEQRIYETHFNMMDHPIIEKKIMASPYANFGLFGICNRSLTANYTRSLLLTKNTQSRPKKAKGKKSVATAQRLPLLKKLYGKERPDSYNAAHFTVKLYKKPAVAILTIFLPLLLMAILNLGVFYQRPNLHKRILSISALMVAIVALVPTIREEIPPIPKITIVEVLVFFESLTTILALIDSLRLGDIGDDDPYIFDGLQNGLFIASFVITVLVNLIIFIIFLLYKCSWEKKYKNLKELIDDVDFQEEPLQHFQWRNIYCEEEFVKFYDDHMLKVVSDTDQQLKMLKDYGQDLAQGRSKMMSPKKMIESFL